MKIRADEHVSPKITRLVGELVKSPSVDLSSVYDSGHCGTKDHHWIRAFAKEGGFAILSADTDFFKKPHQVVAVDDTGLRVVHLPGKWANAPGHLQAAHILMWWQRIERKLAAARPREMWVAKWNISEEGDLEPKNVNYSLHRKKLKKANRSSREKAQARGV